MEEASTGTPLPHHQDATLNVAGHRMGAYVGTPTCVHSCDHEPVITQRWVQLTPAYSPS